MAKQKKTDNYREQVKVIYEMYKHFLHNIAFRYLHDHDLANDVVHDCMLRLLENEERYDISDPSLAQGLVVKITIGLSIDMVRKRTHEINTDELDSQSEIPNEQKKSDDHSSYYLSLIPVEDAQLIKKVLLEGYKLKEIAIEINMSEVAIRKRFQRAKSRLKIAIEKDLGMQNFEGGESIAK